MKRGMTDATTRPQPHACRQETGRTRAAQMQERLGAESECDSLLLEGDAGAAGGGV
jgi:hypothetical protein